MMLWRACAFESRKGRSSLDSERLGIGSQQTGPEKRNHHSPQRLTLVDATLDACFAPAAPDQLIGDTAHDSDALDERLEAERGIALIAPHRSNRRGTPTQTGRLLRRYRRRVGGVTDSVTGSPPHMITLAPLTPHARRPDATSVGPS